MARPLGMATHGKETAHHSFFPAGHGHTWERNCDELRRIIEYQFAARAKCEQTENTKDFDLIQAQV